MSYSSRWDYRVTSIVLRFTDYEADTYHEHRAILSSQSTVWWGWWKKLHEPFPFESLDTLRRQLVEGQQPRIGLINRADNRQFAAICVDFTRNETGSALPSPDRLQTPGYYRDRPCPAWFKLVGIEEMDLAAWTTEFGDVPIGDNTLFWQSEADLPVPKDRVTAPGRGVLHISDLHFGADHGFVVNGSRMFAHAELDEIIASACDPAPAVVVVSGDISTRADPSAFVSARVFLERLLQRLRLDISSLVVVPGNHDILVEELTPTRDYGIEQHYRDFLELLYGRKLCSE